MILYNVTVKIDHEAHDEWLQWMREVHVPEVMATGLFLEHRLAKVLLQDDTEGHTYSFQYTCKDMATMQKYMGSHAPALQASHTARYKDKFVAFRTLLEVL
jgi:hypothetical protein